MEASSSNAAASLCLPSFADRAESNAGPPLGDVAQVQPGSRPYSLALVSRYVRCFREHKSGSIVSVTEEKRGKPCASIRYRCAGCGLLWSARWRS